MFTKRVIILSGHYGSGKTNIAVNLALELKKTRNNVALADLDIVNPYFRARQSLARLQEANIRFIASAYANTNIDAPSLPQEIYAITDDKTLSAVLDVGGDDRGALALGRISAAIKDENNYEMLLVANMYRPLTRTAADTVTVMREIEKACGLPFTGIINNSNLGRETVAQTVLDSLEYVAEVSRLTGLPVVMTAVREDLCGESAGKVERLFPLKLEKTV